jgi:hypothetical protein
MKRKPIQKESPLKKAINEAFKKTFSRETLLEMKREREKKLMKLNQGFILYGILSIH